MDRQRCLRYGRAADVRRKALRRSMRHRGGLRAREGSLWCPWRWGGASQGLGAWQVASAPLSMRDLAASWAWWRDVSGAAMSEHGTSVGGICGGWRRPRTEGCCGGFASMMDGGSEDVEYAECVEEGSRGGSRKLCASFSREGVQLGAVPGFSSRAAQSGARSCRWSRCPRPRS